MIRLIQKKKKKKKKKKKLALLEREVWRQNVTQIKKKEYLKLFLQSLAALTRLVNWFFKFSLVIKLLKEKHTLEGLKEGAKEKLMIKWR